MSYKDTMTFSIDIRTPIFNGKYLLSCLEKDKAEITINCSPCKMIEENKKLREALEDILERAKCYDNGDGPLYIYDIEEMAKEALELSDNRKDRWSKLGYEEPSLEERKRNVSQIIDKINLDRTK